jgi:hypothetical protein
VTRLGGTAAASWISKPLLLSSQHLIKASHIEFVIILPLSWLASGTATHH